MGSGIAQVAAQAGFPVAVVEANDELAKRGLDRLRETFEALRVKGKLDAKAKDALLARIAGTSRLEELKGCELVVEAMTENQQLKNETFAKLGRIAPPHAILATNTSSCNVTAMAAASKRPGQVLGLHFFNPVPLMKLAEAARTSLTDEAGPRLLPLQARSPPAAQEPDRAARADPEEREPHRPALALARPRAQRAEHHPVAGEYLGPPRQVLTDPLLRVLRHRSRAPLRLLLHRAHAPELRDAPLDALAGVPVRLALVHAEEQGVRCGGGGLEPVEPQVVHPREEREQEPRDADGHEERGGNTAQRGRAPGPRRVHDRPGGQPQGEGGEQRAERDDHGGAAGQIPRPRCGEAAH